jgi:pimeloyl-ACP methyl ester carboxylesterase
LKQSRNQPGIFGKIVVVTTQSALHVERGGTGEPTLLLLHGMAGSAAVWGGFIDLLGQAWPGSWIAPDLPGHGRSPKLAKYTYDAMAEAVAELIPPGAQVAVLGHSLGGAVGFALAAGPFDLQVTGVVGVGIKVRWSEQELAGAAEIGQRHIPLCPTREEAVDRAVKSAGLAGLWPPDAPGVDSLLEHLHNCWRPVFDLKALGVGAPDIAGALAALAQRGVPATLAAGERDPVSPAEHLQALVADPVILPGLGHSAHVEDPAALLPLLERLRS